MEQTVRVKSCDPSGTAEVVHIRQSACSGECHKCSGCGAAKEIVLLTVQNPIGAKPGQLVRITANSGPVLRAAAILYILPICLFIVGYLLMMSVELGWLGGIVGFAIGGFLVWVYDRFVVAKQNTDYTITAILDGDTDKGENDLD